MLANINREQVHHHIPDLEAKSVLSPPQAHQPQNSRMNPMLLNKRDTPAKEPKSPQPSSLVSGPAEDEEMSDLPHEEDHDMDVKKD